MACEGCNILFLYACSYDEFQLSQVLSRHGLLCRQVDCEHCGAVCHLPADLNFRSQKVVRLRKQKPTPCNRPKKTGKSNTIEGLSTAANISESVENNVQNMQRKDCDVKYKPSEQIEMNSTVEMDVSTSFLTSTFEKQELKCEVKEMVDIQEDCDVTSEDEVLHQTHTRTKEKTKQSKDQIGAKRNVSSRRKYKSYKSDSPTIDLHLMNSKTKIPRKRSKRNIIKRFKCRTCGSLYECESQLQSHENSVHLRLKPFLCKYCEKTFSNKITMLGHVNSVHIQLKIFKCETCMKTFAFRSNLNKHRRFVHLRLKPHVCQVCQSGFAQRGHLLTHERTVHARIRPFSCDVCRKSFVRKIDLDGHMNCVHLKVKPFKCEDCGKVFGRKNVLATHQKSVHLKIKPFSCDVCGESYPAKKELIKHLAKHKSSTEIDIHIL